MEAGPRWLRIALLAAASVSLMLVAAVANPGRALAEPGESRLLIAFSQVESDDRVAQLMQQTGIRIHAAYLASAGLTGVHRERDPFAVGRFVAETRAQTIENLGDALVGNSRRIEEFVGRHSRVEVTSNARLLTLGRSLLQIRSQLLEAAAHARHGDPLIYAVEVRGADAEQIERLTDSEMVDAVIPNSVTAATLVKPAALKSQFQDSVVEHLDADGVYDAMLASILEGD